MSEGKTALDIRVDALDSEVREVNSRLANLDDKFDRVMTGFGEEFRAAITSLSAQFNERQKTPWGVLISGASVVLSVCVILGGLAVSPVQSRISKLEEDTVPRKEVEFRDRVLYERITELQGDVKKQFSNERERLLAELDGLKRENALLRSSGGVVK